MSPHLDKGLHGCWISYCLFVSVKGNLSIIIFTEFASF
jgi:hypothetical protein